MIKYIVIGFVSPALNIQIEKIDKATLLKVLTICSQLNWELWRTVSLINNCYKLVEKEQICYLLTLLGVALILEYWSIWTSMGGISSCCYSLKISWKWELCWCILGATRWDLKWTSKYTWKCILYQSLVLTNSTIKVFEVLTAIWIKSTICKKKIRQAIFPKKFEFEYRYITSFNTVKII